MVRRLIENGYSIAQFIATTRGLPVEYSRLIVHTWPRPLSVAKLLTNAVGERGQNYSSIAGVEHYG